LQLNVLDLFNDMTGTVVDRGHDFGRGQGCMILAGAGDWSNIDIM
jgi:hypothetical protein